VVRLLGLAPAVLLVSGLFAVWAGPLAAPVAATAPTGVVVAWGDNDYGQTIAPAGLSSVTFVAGGSDLSLALEPSAKAKTLVVKTVSPWVAGAAHGVTVTVKDAYGNVATGYRGTIHFTTSDTKASVPAKYKFTAADKGVHTFSYALSPALVLKTAGTQWVRATDTLTAAITGVQTGIVVTPAKAKTLVVKTVSPWVAGAAHGVTVTVKDAYGNVATGYRGTIHFTTSDTKASVPAKYKFTAADKGVHTFSYALSPALVLKTAGTQWVRATDTLTAAITGVQTGIVVTPTPVTVPNAPSNISAAATNSSTIHVTWSDNSNNEDGFRISDSLTTLTVAAGTTSYDWTGLAGGTYKCTEVQAYNSAGSSAWTSWGCTTTPTNNFSIGVNPTTVPVVQGATGTSTISTAQVSGSAETVTLSISALPSGVTAAFSPTSVTAGGSSTLTFTVSGSTTVGTYPATVTGTAASATHSTPVTLVVSEPAAAIAAGDEHMCALLVDHTVQCWGRNDLGQLGDGTTTDRPNAVAVSGLTGVIAISAGGAHTCALLSGGAVSCWGHNSAGQLGDGTTLDRTSPVAVSGLTGAIAISAGGASTCALLAGGTVSCWGDNLYGELADGTTTNRATPATVSGLTGATMISAGMDHICALLSGGTVKCWGNNDVGQVGDGTTTQRHSPIAVSGLTRATQISAGGAFSCALLSGGAVSCWGDNASGQLGNGSTTNSSTPVSTLISGVTAMSAGYDHTCVPRSNGTVACWGADTYGGLGDGATTDNPTPAAVAGISGATAVLSGLAHSCALVTAGEVTCWGGNSHGQLGNGAIASNAATDVAPANNPVPATLPHDVSRCATNSSVPTKSGFPPYGTVMASVDGVQICSNGGYGSNGDSPQILGTYGEMYQCTELIRRFFYAHDWVSSSYLDLSKNWNWTGNAETMAMDPLPDDGHGHQLIRIPNGPMPPTTLPVRGDALVFSNSGAGHIALVTAVSGGKVYFVEQNWNDPTKWGQDSLAITSQGIEQRWSGTEWDKVTSWIHAPMNTGAAGRTVIRISASFPGIGINPAAGENSSPVHTTRSVTVRATSTSDLSFYEGTAVLTYQPSNGRFEGEAWMPQSLPPGKFTIALSAANTSTAHFGGGTTTPFTPCGSSLNGSGSSVYGCEERPRAGPWMLSQDNTWLPTWLSGVSSDGYASAAATAGVTHEELRFRQMDINNDGVVDVLDYNVWLLCSIYGTPARCTAPMRAASDLDDNGVVNEYDYNLWLRMWYGTS
jgi:alpha-tubulin suppressor-like RCC1 family protein